MSRGLSEKSKLEIEKFELLGYAKSTDNLLAYARSGKNPYIRFFKPGTSRTVGRGSITFSSVDIFGTISDGYKVNILFDIRRKKDFVDFLVEKFLGKNPNPSFGMKLAFSRLLHNNGLHWKECCRRHHKDDITYENM